VYRTLAWFGVVTGFVAYVVSNSATVVFSYVAGLVLGALLLKSQEIFARRLMRPKGSPAYQGWDRFIPLWVLIPGKYLLVALALGWGIKNQVVLPAVLGLGFLAVQVVLMAKMFGKLIAAQARPIREVYIDKKPKA
jgi:hypothetical protein